MKMKAIIESIAQAHQFAAALEIVGTIGNAPGQPADIAAVAHTAARLSEQLAATQRLIAREVANLKGSHQATATRADEDVVQMLIRSQEVQ